ncbi:MAG TPA: hypothetical protein RMG45_01975, partial [Polyangiaceae bacterium LLY-WYZ-15_(1-7)]|nr:hypothetical protein [Polyangiaceae bacterium LLY-WYZ-15_(1-7)]
MFEAAEVGHRLSKDEWDAQIPELRRKLLEAEYRLVEDPRAAVAVVVAGVDGAGKGDSINQLHAWMDTRHLRTHGLGLPTEEERRYPPMWRFWRRLPPRGQIGVFMGSWYTAPIIDRVFGRTDAAELDRQLDRIRRFERMLAHERVVLLKLWFHLSKEDQETRLKKLEGSKRTAWRVSKRDWEHFELYDTFKEVSAHALRRTSIDVAPWVIVPGAEPRYRQAMVGEAL